MGGSGGVRKKERRVVCRCLVAKPMICTNRGKIGFGKRTTTPTWNVYMYVSGGGGSVKEESQWILFDRQTRIPVRVAALPLRISFEDSPKDCAIDHVLHPTNDRHPSW